MNIIPTVPERPAELAALEERCAGFHDERLDLEAELTKLQTAAWNEGQMNVVALDMAASRLAAGEDVPALRDVEEIRKRLELVSTAERQVRAKIAELRDQHAERTARAFRPAHRACVARIAKAVVELAAANRAEQDLRGMVPGIRLRQPKLSDNRRISASTRSDITDSGVSVNGRSGRQAS